MKGLVPVEAVLLVLVQRHKLVGMCCAGGQAVDE